MDAPFNIIFQERDDFETIVIVGLDTLHVSWADSRWSTWSKESNLSYVNAAFVENGSSISSYNVKLHFR